MKSFQNKEECERYDRWFESTEGRDWFQREWDLMGSLLSPEPRDVLLDVGCGPGRHLEEWRKRGHRCAGLDVSPHMVELCRRRVGPFVPVYRGFAESLPFPDKHFDIVVFIKSLEFFEDPALALREAWRVARKHVFIGILNSCSLAGIKHSVLWSFKDSVFRHARLFTLWGVRRLVCKTMLPVQMEWASIRTAPWFSSHRADHRSVGTSPFGDLLAVRLDLAQTIQMRAMASNRVPKGLGALIHGAARGGYERSPVVFQKR